VASATLELEIRAAEEFSLPVSEDSLDLLAFKLLQRSGSKTLNFDERGLSAEECILLPH
jgi:hypothetical protein